MQNNKEHAAKKLVAKKSFFLHFEKTCSKQDQTCKLTCRHPAQPGLGRGQNRPKKPKSVCGASAEPRFFFCIFFRICNDGQIAFQHPVNPTPSRTNWKGVLSCFYLRSHLLHLRSLFKSFKKTTKNFNSIDFRFKQSYARLCGCHWK